MPYDKTITLTIVINSDLLESYLTLVKARNLLAEAKQDPAGVISILEDYSWAVTNTVLDAYYARKQLGAQSD
ncbi:MAG: hypothetical protein Q4D87_08870 [Actinomycetaceae bacterium]|nr:hypothetical protein [Actinomycetaceae bacterium]